MTRPTGVVLGMLFVAHVAAGQFTQQGSKFAGTGAVGAAKQGASVAVSADGATAIVGGLQDDSNAGAVWVFTRTGGVWSQQGGKLVGAGAAGAAKQGTSVAISADGSTAIVGGPNDNSGAGAAWVYTRGGGVWSQQGSKLVGTGAGSTMYQGTSVAISADGNTAIVGGPYDASGVGAAWVFTRSAGVWSQQSSKLVGTGAVGKARQGSSVAISTDSNTAVVGGPMDSSSAGAVWVFTRSGGTWSQQGSKLVGTGSVGGAIGLVDQGWSLAVSADGNTVIQGAWGDNSGVGAAWVFSRSAEVWSQQGSKLVGSSAVGNSQQGQAVSIAADGNTAIVGGYLDNSSAGATWVYTRSGGVWSQQGDKLVGSGAAGSARQGYSVAISADASTVIVGGLADNTNAGASWVFSAPTSSTVWVPVASHNGGKNGSRWRSDLGLLNLGAAQANVQLSFFGSGSVVTSSTLVPAGTQSILADVVEQIGGANSGAIEVVSDQPLKVTARSYNQVATDASCYPGGTQGQDYPAVTASDGLAAQQSAYLAGLTENASYHCNIGVVNTGTGSASVLVELFNGAGTKLTDYTVPLTAGLWAQETQPFLGKAGQTAMDRGYAKITVQSGSGVFAFASVISNATNDPTTIAMQSSSVQAATAQVGDVPVVSVPAFSAWVPVASHNGGKNGSQWRSDLGLLNLGAAQANVQLSFYGSGPVVTNATYVPAGTQSILTDVVEQIGGANSGAIEVVSDRSLLVTARSYNQVATDASCYPGGTQGQDYPAVPPSSGLSAGESAYLAGLTENASYHCNIGVVNTGTGNASVLVELFNGAGTKLTDYTVPLTAGLWAQETQPFLGKAGQTAMDRGYAKVTVQSGSGVFAFASVIDNLTNDPTTITTVR